METRRRTLEEISEIFNSRKPVKTSLSKTKIIMHGNRGVTEMLDKEEEGMGTRRPRSRFEMVGFGNRAERYG